MGVIPDNVIIDPNLFYKITMDHFGGLPAIPGCHGPYAFSPTCCKQGNILNQWTDGSFDCEVGQALCAVGGGFDQERLKNIEGPFTDAICTIPA